VRKSIKKLIVTVLSLVQVGAFCFSGSWNAKMNDVYAATESDEDTKKDIADVAIRIGQYSHSVDFKESDCRSWIVVTFDGTRSDTPFNRAWTNDIVDFGDIYYAWYLNGELVLEGIDAYGFVIYRDNDLGIDYDSIYITDDFAVVVPNASLTLKLTVIESDYFYGTTEVVAFDYTAEDDPTTSDDENNEEEDSNKEEGNSTTSDNESNEEANSNNEEEISSDQNDNVDTSSPSSNKENKVSATQYNNNVVTSSTGESITSTIPTQVNSGISAALTTHGSVINFAAGLSESEKNDGIHIESRISDSQCGELAKQSLQIAAESVGAKTAHTLEIYMGMVGKNGAPQGDIESLLMPIEICLSIPDGIDGSLYDFAVVRLQKDGTFVILPDIGTDSTTINFETDQFGVFSIIYGEKGSFDTYKN